jgi:hypothetical protein
MLEPILHLSTEFHFHPSLFFFLLQCLALPRFSPQLWCVPPLFFLYISAIFVFSFFGWVSKMKFCPTFATLYTLPSPLSSSGKQKKKHTKRKTNRTSSTLKGEGRVRMRLVKDRKCTNTGHQQTMRHAQSRLGFCWRGKGYRILK